MPRPLVGDRPLGDGGLRSVAPGWRRHRLGLPRLAGNRDPVPAPYRSFPGTDRIIVSGAVPPVADLPPDAEAAIVMECSDLTRPEVSGLERAEPLKVVAPPVRMSATPGRVRRAAPRLGEPTDEVLRERLGLDEAAISRLRESHAIGARQL